MAPIFNLPLTPMSESVPTSPTELLDPENVDVAFGISLKSCIVAEILCCVISTSNFWRPSLTCDSRRRCTVFLSVTVCTATTKMPVWFQDSRWYLIHKLRHKFFIPASGLWPPSWFPVRIPSSTVHHRSPIWTAVMFAALMNDESVAWPITTCQWMHLSILHQTISTAFMSKYPSRASSFLLSPWGYFTSPYCRYMSQKPIAIYDGYETSTWELKNCIILFMEFFFTICFNFSFKSSEGKKIPFILTIIIHYNCLPSVDSYVLNLL